MNLIPSPSRIDIILHESHAAWWQIVAAVGPFVVILGAVLFAAMGWLRPWGLKPKAGSQSDWWPRARWALEATLDDDPKRREVGLTALKLLNESSLSGTEESVIIAEAWKEPLREARTMVSSSETMAADRTGPKEDRVIVRAARLRLSTDQKQGIESPSWVKEIAQRPL
ncbi:hypothetical protein QFZ40_001617 [Arthrobacter pascens]|uniref:hypothetical protein n=1 Tax=Arthrobacter pascens TaxID=1677 RepID=UPI00277E7176|nr:hypothetical protein [Arthrobacter pascens]MDQ0633708.1 hypothetical protein [Arthrobacter pascens]